MGIKDTEMSLRTLGNASELVAAIAQEVVGNDVADSINGSVITRDVVYQLAQSQFAARLSNLTK